MGNRGGSGRLRRIASGDGQMWLCHDEGISEEQFSHSMLLEDPQTLRVKGLG